MSQSSRFAPLVARCSTALLVVVALAGLALYFCVDLVLNAPWWLRQPGMFLGLFLFLTCGAAVRRRLRENRRSG